MKKIVIAGGTGFIGNYIASRFQDTDYRVLIVSRQPKHLSWKLDELTHALDGAEMLINLAGKSINSKLTEENRTEILNSRIQSTILLGDAIQACKTPPKLWINASAIGIYRSSFTNKMTEDETQFSTDFLSEVVQQWEKTLFDFQLTKTRQVALRTSVVLGRNGGALELLANLVRYRLGGKQGTGKQMISWIHEEDYFRALLFINENPTLAGVINCTSPKPVSNNEFMFTLRKKLHVTIGIPAPTFVIKLASKLIGIDAGLILNSLNVIPKRLTNAGFSFHYPTLYLALIDLLRSHRT